MKIKACPLCTLSRDLDTPGVHCLPGRFSDELKKLEERFKEIDKQKKGDGIL